VSAQSGYFPRVSASAGYSWRGSYSSLSRSPNSPSNEFSDFGNSRSLSWGLSFSFPIFSGWQTDNQVQSAVVARKNAEENLRENARQIGVDVRTSILQLQAAMKNYEAAIKNLEFQDKNLKVNQERFKIGAGTMLDLLYAENNYKSALTSKINAVYQYLNTKSQLEYAMGTIQY
jgi:outer membrane protein